MYTTFSSKHIMAPWIKHDNIVKQDLSAIMGYTGLGLSLPPAQQWYHHWVMVCTLQTETMRAYGKITTTTQNAAILLGMTLYDHSVSLASLYYEKYATSSCQFKILSCPCSIYPHLHIYAHNHLYATTIAWKVSTQQRNSIVLSNKCSSYAYTFRDSYL